MRGVPADLDLQPFIGARLDQICLGKWQLQFSFTRPEARIGPDFGLSVEGYWELRDAGGALVDHGPNGGKNREGTEPIAQATFRAHPLLTLTVVSFHLEPPESFTLTFDDGQRLRVYDNSDRYESFSFGGVYI